MIILDTNVLSILLEAKPNPSVFAWLNQQTTAKIFWTTAITIFEIQMGLHLIPQGKRRAQLEKSFELAVDQVLEDRILELDQAAASVAGKLAAKRRLSGINTEFRDSMIAGIAITRYATIATRNVKDFSDLKVKIINPWDFHE